MSPIWNKAIATWPSMVVIAASVTDLVSDTRERTCSLGRNRWFLSWTQKITIVNTGTTVQSRRLYLDRFLVHTFIIVHSRISSRYFSGVIFNGEQLVQILFKLLLEGRDLLEFKYRPTTTHSWIVKKVRATKQISIGSYFFYVRKKIIFARLPEEYPSKFLGC